MNDFVIVIPARLKSTRLPNKMMLLIGEQPVIEHTWRQAMSVKAKKVIVATDDPTIYDHMRSIGAEVVMTSSDHPTGTDRLAEVANICGFQDEEIIVNWQGDEPFLPYEYIQKVATKLACHENAAMSTLATAITTWDDFLNPNVVKVVHNHVDGALYFSRAPIPYPRGVEQGEGTLPEHLTPERHIGVYAYRAFFLKAYPKLQPSHLEQVESLEQLRALSNGYQIVVEKMNTVPPVGIDTEAELTAARAWYAKEKGQ
ncbi:3-deoxy-manno-octulosonate cytidylyltransferase [Wohlfahrtiimonas chitiniclastica]|uniref:3-deoxy-manno-octulosonate cytidylyltransferase n=1 Tax=Wohlfahrtiimonas chitiniclastica TaxID=400946 RepID=UPI001BCCA554|nr:3-deoxy-manno-octulosonate cytidylyltransferase [Wohlfahrtiimonas chitiniclastica]MBS7817904.1 3-deoxy-manno-octulosonate cytidylyltransferase [Wohlfahrtiimonas chitiniclastica]MBS7825871.1 3-deoxy-manno-octulosonate cytidylyltransferase [Wohlfahrtiimonas chitiniclastica]